MQMKDIIQYLIFFTFLNIMGCSARNYESVENPIANDINIKEEISEYNGDNEVNVVCLVYHRFGDDRFPSTNIELSLFENQLKYLTENGFKSLSASEAVEIVEYGINGNDNNKYFCITIDDGYKSIIKGAVPLLRKFDVKATIFINTRHVGYRDYLNWIELKKLRDMGIEIGCHSHEHPYFLNIPDDQRDSIFQLDTETALNQFEKEMGSKPEIYAYPYGEFDERMPAILKKIGIMGAFAQFSGVFSTTSQKYRIPRFPINTQYGKMDDFIQKVNMKSIYIIKSSPEEHIVLNSNPPSLKLTIVNNDFELREMQYFVNGRTEKFRISGNDTLIVELMPSEPIISRRNLYTITLPSVNHTQWFWYTHIWFRPEID